MVNTLDYPFAFYSFIPPTMKYPTKGDIATILIGTALVAIFLKLPDLFLPEKVEFFTPEPPIECAIFKDNPPRVDVWPNKEECKDIITIH